MHIKLLEDELLPKDFQYPNDLKRVVDLGLVNFDVWYFMDRDQVEVRINGLIQRYPNRSLIPFARRCDNDDIACFEVNKGEQVIIIHDFAASGYEQRECFETFWQWFRYAIEVMIEFE